MLLKLTHIAFTILHMYCQDVSSVQSVQSTLQQEYFLFRLHQLQSQGLLFLLKPFELLLLYVLCVLKLVFEVADELLFDLLFQAGFQDTRQAGHLPVEEV